MKRHSDRCVKLVLCTWSSLNYVASILLDTFCSGVQPAQILMERAFFETPLCHNSQYLLNRTLKRTTINRSENQWFAVDQVQFVQTLNTEMTTENQTSTFNACGFFSDLNSKENIMRAYQITETLSYSYVRQASRWKLGNRMK